MAKRLRVPHKDRINMTADEFFDHWSTWCAMPVSVETADTLTAVLTGIMREFEVRGSVTHHRAILKPDMTFIYQSPEDRADG